MDITDYSFLEKIVFNTHLFSLEFLKILSPHLGVLTLPWIKKNIKKKPSPADALFQISWNWPIGSEDEAGNVKSLRHRLTCQHILPPKSLNLAFGSVLNFTEKYAPQCTMIFNHVSSHECDRFICLSLSQWEILESLSGYRGKGAVTEPFLISSLSYFEHNSPFQNFCAYQIFFLSFAP